MAPVIWPFCVSEVLRPMLCGLCAFLALFYATFRCNSGVNDGWRSLTPMRSFEPNGEISVDSSDPQRMDTERFWSTPERYLPGLGFSLWKNAGRFGVNFWSFWLFLKVEICEIIGLRDWIVFFRWTCWELNWVPGIRSHILSEGLQT